MTIKTIIQEKKVILALFAYAFILLFFCSKMSPLYPINEWSDVNLYFNIGKMVNDGKIIYTEAFDHKGPLIFFIYAAGAFISDTSFFGMYIIESLAWALILIFTYFSAKLFVDKIRAILIALVYPIFLLWYTLSGGSAEEFIVVTQIISLYFFLKYFKEKDPVTHNPQYMILHGVMSSIAMLIKINLVIFWFFPLLAIFVNLFTHKEYKNLSQNIAAYLTGVFIIVIPCFTYFLTTNSFSEFWNIYINLNKNYAAIGGVAETIKNLGIRFYLLLRFETFYFSLILIGAIYFPLKYINKTKGKIGIILSFVCLYIIILASSKHVYYYSIPITIFIPLALIIFSKYLNIRATKKTYCILFVIVLVTSIKQKDFYGAEISSLILRRESEALNKSEGIIFDFAETIKKEQNPTLLNLGLDKGNAVFTEANIIPNVRYFISPNLPYDIYPNMRDEQTKYIENKDIKFIIMMSESINYGYFVNLKALDENYAIMDSITDDENKTYYLYKRKD